MGYLFHINSIHSEIRKNKNLTILFISICIFTFIYYFLSDTHFNVKSTRKMDLFEAFYLSVVTQSLLGPGDINPKSKKAKFFLLAQVIVTFFVTLMYVKK